ncbi:MAG: enolase C-terminal domain-like protein, partial [Flavobacteriaceae bacterium]
MANIHHLILGLMQATFSKHRLKFKLPSGTSRGVLTTKDSWFITLSEADRKGVGECSLIKGLSPDDTLDFENKLTDLCKAINKKTLLPDLEKWPAIRMGFETALLDLKHVISHQLFPSDFAMGAANIPINGLVWMGTFENMNEQIKSLLKRDFNCIKLKIGAIDFDQELQLLAKIRKEFSAQDIIIRVDANGGWSLNDAKTMIKWLADRKAEYVEQPLKEGDEDNLKYLFKGRPLPIIIDESCRFSEDVVRYSEYVDGVNLKLMKCGGITEALKIL